MGSEMCIRDSAKQQSACRPDRTDPIGHSAPVHGAASYEMTDGEPSTKRSTTRLPAAGQTGHPVCWPAGPATTIDHVVPACSAVATIRATFGARASGATPSEAARTVQGRQAPTAEDGQPDGDAVTSIVSQRSLAIVAH